MRAKPVSLALLLATAPVTACLADVPMNGLRPVPKTGSQIIGGQPAHQPQHDGWNLQWRKSPALNQDQPEQLVAGPSDDSATMRPGLRQTSSMQPMRGSIALSPAPVARAAFAQPQFGMPDVAPIPADEPNALQAPVPSAEDANDFFNNPFGDEPNQTAPNAELPPPRATVPSPTRQPDPALPSDTRPMNDLRRELDSFGRSNSNDKASSGSPPKPRSSQSEGPSMRDLLERERAPKSPKIDDIDSPSDRDEPFANPFGDRSQQDRSSKDRDADEQSRQEAEQPRASFRDEDDEQLRKIGGLSCEDFRKRLAELTIRDVSLDPSPPFRPDIIEEDEFKKVKEKFDEKQQIRQWRSIDGQPLASGRLVDLAYEKAVIRTEFGTNEELQINRLSETDLAFISENWGLPTECLIEQVAYQPRTWTPTKMTYKASELCHKPLYFEEVNLERYGHTTGPFLQPVVSSAHFFVNIAVLPYKMGIHPPSECQYALGYYRPGNCAPWIVPPVPLSLRGGLSQAAAMTGAFWLIP